MLKAEASWPHLPGTGRKEIEVVPRGIKAGTYHAESCSAFSFQPTGDSVTNKGERLVAP